MTQEIAIETEEQKQKRADTCMQEVVSILKKYNCRFAVTTTTDTENPTTTRVRVVTNK